MRLYPDKWELGLTGVNVTTRRVDSLSEGYGSEADAREAFRGMQSNSHVRYTLAVIYPPEGLNRQPIYLVGGPAR